jgi:membrane-bound ClpP family serine protease
MMKRGRIGVLGFIIFLLGLASYASATSVSISEQRTATVTITLRILYIRAIVLDSETLEIKEIKSNTGALNMTPEAEREEIRFEVYIEEISRGGNIGLSEIVWQKYLEIRDSIDWSKKGVVYKR